MAVTMRTAVFWNVVLYTPEERVLSDFKVEE
jgi:hypothetical protein